MAKFNMQSLELRFMLQPDTGEWIVTHQMLNGEGKERKTFEELDAAVRYVWDLMYAHARTAYEIPDPPEEKKDE